MAKDKGLHPILSFATSLMLVGSTLYLLQASLGSREAPTGSEPVTTPQAPLSLPVSHEGETVRTKRAMSRLPATKLRELSLGSPEYSYGASGAEAELEISRPKQLFEAAEATRLNAIKPQSVLTAAAPPDAEGNASADFEADNAPDEIGQVRSAEHAASRSETELKVGRPTQLAAAEVPRVDTIRPRLLLAPTPPERAQAQAEDPGTSRSEVQVQPAENGVGPTDPPSSIPRRSVESPEAIQPIGPSSPLVAAPPREADHVSGAELQAEGSERTIDEVVTQPALVEPLSPDRVIPSSELPQPNHATGTGSGEKEPSKDIAAAAPPPPLRRPSPPQPSTAAPDHPPRHQLADSGAMNRVRPMTLAPPDTVPERRAAPAQSQSLSAYRRAVWAALARHKPKAGERGSALVSFGISPGGGLGFVRISRSSGNPRLDQLALATVRRAAPFPDPPESLRYRPYTIRIDFH
jgi:protein TonB